MAETPFPSHPIPSFEEFLVPSKFKVEDAVFRDQQEAKEASTWLYKKPKDLTNRQLNCIMAQAQPNQINSRHYIYFYTHEIHQLFGSNKLATLTIKEFNQEQRDALQSMYDRTLQTNACQYPLFLTRSDLRRLFGMAMEPIDWTKAPTTTPSECVLEHQLGRIPVKKNGIKIVMPNAKKMPPGTRVVARLPGKARDGHRDHLVYEWIIGNDLKESYVNRMEAKKIAMTLRQGQTVLRQTGTKRKAPDAFEITDTDTDSDPSTNSNSTMPARKKRRT